MWEGVGGRELGLALSQPCGSGEEGGVVQLSMLRAGRGHGLAPIRLHWPEEFGSRGG